MGMSMVLNFDVTNGVEEDIWNEYKEEDTNHCCCLYLCMCN